MRMEVKAARDRLETRGEIDLDGEEDVQNAKNFAVVITKAGAASLKAAGIADPAADVQGKTIRAKGTVQEVDGGRGSKSTRETTLKRPGLVLAGRRRRGR